MRRLLEALDITGLELIIVFCICLICAIGLSMLLT